jgi:hypothetical protein
MRIRDFPIERWFMKQVYFVCGLVVVLSGQPSSAQPSGFGSSPVNSPPATSSQSIHVIKLHGSVGRLPDSPAQMRGITAQAVEREINSPEARFASVIVLDIDGPGGLVSEMQEIVEILFKAQSLDQRRIVALPRDAFSAWSMICLACKEIVVTPTSRMGAAVTVTKMISGYVEAPEGKDAVSQKMAAPWKARMRSICRFTNRCECIPDAMCEQGKQLWWSPTKGLSAQRGSEPDWKCLDDHVGVCCLTGDELVETKVAIGMVRSVQELPSLLGLPAATVVESSKPIESTTERQSQSADSTVDLRKAAAKLREARDLLRVEELFGTRSRNYSATEQYSDPRVSGGIGTRTITKARPETDAEKADRIQGTLRKVRAKLPSDNSVDSDAKFAAALIEIRTLLDEALQHLRNDALSAARDRARRADRMMDLIAKSY